MGRLANSVAAGLSLSMPFVLTGEPTPRPLTVDEARLAIAKRFASCAIVSATTTPDGLDPHLDNILLSFRLKETPAAVRAKQLFPEDSKLRWSQPPPAVAATIINGPGRPAYVGAGWLGSAAGSTANVTTFADLDPGTRLDISIVQRVENADTPGRRYHIASVSHACGALTARMVNGRLNWQPDPTAPRLPNTLYAVDCALVPYPVSGIDGPVNCELNTLTYFPPSN